jgi:nucleoside-diphosphate-sugar epimerase
MRTVLVLGATGGLGSAAARRLAGGGWTVRALHRNPSSIETAEPFEWIRGDALVLEDVERAADGVQVIVHAVKPRLYRDWHRLVLPMIDNTIAAAHGARIVIPGNVYNYGPDAGSSIGEDAPQHPETSKGRLRVEMERRIANAVEAGRAKALIVRAGDFFGPGAGSSWFSDAMVKPGRRPRIIRNPAKPGVGHQWTYLPDLAETMVQLIEHDPLPAFARFHMGGHWDSDGTEMVAAIVRALGQPEVSVGRLPWWAVWLAAPFKPEFKELLELKYLWERPVRLRNELLVATLGGEPHTPLDDAVQTTLKSILRS